MRIGGKTIDGPKQVTLAIPRDDGDIIFKFVAVCDDAEFDKILTPPEPPTTFDVKTQQTLRKLTDPAYLKKLQEYRLANNAWVFLKSIEPSKIEWDTVNPAVPSTWNNWQDDLKKAGFSLNEVNVIWGAFQRANILTDDMLNEARTRFLALQEATESSPKP